METKVLIQSGQNPNAVSPHHHHHPSDAPDKIDRDLPACLREIHV